MINFFRNDAQAADQSERTPTPISLGAALNQLLELFRTHDDLSMNVSLNSVVTATGTPLDWLTNYESTGSVRGDRDFETFWHFSRLLRCFTWRTDPQIDLRAACWEFAKGRSVPEFTYEDSKSITAMIVYLCGWVRGRKVEPSITTDDEVSALLLALEAEFDTTTPLEETFRALV